MVRGGQDRGRPRPNREGGGDERGQRGEEEEFSEPEAWSWHGLVLAQLDRNVSSSRSPTDVVWGDLSSFVVTPQVVDGSIEFYINPRSHPKKGLSIRLRELPDLAEAGA